jgi:hypothetical protein
MLNIIAKSPDKCADSILFLSTAEELKEKTGRTFDGINERLSVPYWKKDETITKRLWKETGTYLNKFNA